VTTEQKSGKPSAGLPEHQAAPGGDRPWERLDPALATVLEPELPAMAAEIIDQIGRAIPEYRRPLEGSFGRGLRVGVQEALSQFLTLVGRPEAQSTSAREVYAALGRGELRAGRGLDALQAAYRVGARVAWRRVSAAARRAGADAATVSLLAESIFAYIDEISSESVEGYAQAQAQTAGEQQRRRRRLVLALVTEERPDEAALAVMAAEAAWPLPRTLAALVSDEPDAARLVARLGPEVIGARVGEISCALVPDAAAPGRREELAAAAGRAAAVLGPNGAPLDARVSFSRARAGLLLARAGLLGNGGLVAVEEHLAALLLHGDPGLAEDLARRRLRALDALGSSARERLRITLMAWLRRQGHVPAVATDLHVHRQTVRYRLSRLRELLGAALEDPDARFEIELALRATASPQTGAPADGPGGAAPPEPPGQVGKP
jgi:PucR-like helix-turn-helix protein